MAGRFDFGSRPNLSVPTPLHSSNDVQGSENPIPLSPQWLLPKPGESKHVIGTGDNHFNHQPAYGNRVDMMKVSDNSEDVNDAQKKRDVFRPSFTEVEISRRDRWHDEERENSSSMRKDRWRDGEKELGDGRKIDRWVEDSSTRVFREPRRAPSERWADSGNRDNTHYDQRRESKWNTRWGPDDKETEGFREKRLDSGRDGGDIHIDKNFSHGTNYGKNDREGEHYRPWRPSASQSRGKGEPPHQQAQTPSKQVPTFSYGRGRTENTPTTFSLGRGIISSGLSSTNNIYSPSNSIGASSEKSAREPYHYKYNRTKLLDVYRTTNLTPHPIVKDGLMSVPSLTLDEPLEPLALCAPSTEEVTFLKGIDKGEIVSSGAPQVSKDGRNPSEFVPTRRTKLGVAPSPGGREDLPHGYDDCNDDKDDNTTRPGNINHSEVSMERQMSYSRSQSKIETTQDRMAHAGNKFKAEAFREDDAATRKADEVPVNRESGLREGTPVPASSWNASLLEQPLSASFPDWRGSPNDIAATPEKGWLPSPKNLNDGWGSNSATPAYPKDNPKWQTGEESVIRRQLSGLLEKEPLARKTFQSAPEELQLLYVDPSGAIQGPFSGADIIQWFESGYFGLDLPVRLAGAPSDVPFASLGDVMPHLRSKSKPPPGFTGPKPNEFVDANALGSSSYGGMGKLHPGVNELDALRSDARLKHGSNVEAENRFLESLMTGNLGASALEKGAFSEGLSGYFGNNSTGLSSLGVENGNNLLLLAKRMELERQRSLNNNPYAFWPGVDAAAKVSKSDIALDDSIQQAKLLSSIIDHSRQTSHSQGVDLSAVLQSLSDKAPPGINDAASWSKFASQGAPDALQNKHDMHHDLNFSSQAPFGFQPQRLQPQPPITNLLAQPTDNPTLTPDKFLSSSLSQDPQLINKLQQQHLLQLHSQLPFSAQQMSLLDKLLLLKQQEKQEEQQRLLQQQQLLSQVISEHQSRQHFGDPSFGQLQAASIPMVNASPDPSKVQLSREKFHIGPQNPVLNVQTDHATNFGNMGLQVTQGVSYNVSSGDKPLPLPLPHEMFGNIVSQKSWSAALSEQLNDTHLKDMLPESKFSEGLPLSGIASRTAEDGNRVFNGSDSRSTRASEQVLEDVPRVDANVTVVPKISLESLSLEAPKVSAEICNNEISIPESGLPVVKGQDDGMFVEKLERDACKVDVSLEADLKNVEVQEPKKSSEKKTKKQKSSKMLSSDLAKEAKNSAPQPSKQSKCAKPELSDLKLKADSVVGKPCDTPSPKKTKDRDVKNAFMDVVDCLPVQSSAAHAVNSLNDGDIVEIKSDSRTRGSDPVLSSQSQSGQKAWKLATGFKAKSLLEIQEEEQKMAQTETAPVEISNSISSMSSSTPWAGIVGSLDLKASKEIHKDSGNADPCERYGNVATSRSGKSQLHDLLAEDDVDKSRVGDIHVSESVQIAPAPHVTTAVAESIDDNFIEAKDTKKSRKKSAKSKGVGAKVPSSVTSTDAPVSSSPIEKGKISRQTQQEKDVIPAIPSGPSFADFVPWKGEAANPSPAPAWSSDSGKIPKPASLRDIQKEQGRKGSSTQHSHQMVTPQKTQPTQVGRSNSSTTTWPLSASSPSKAASTLQNNPSQSKYGGGDDDLFWGPIDQPKHENQQVEVRLGSQGSWGSRSTQAKAASSGLLSRQKSSGGKADHLSSSPAAHSAQKGKVDPVTKHSEAMGFRDWCESECVRLIGTKDTSFLEFCLKQSRSEAELLLKENIGSFDPDHEFIDQFLNYKELLTADVLEIAFQSRGDRKVWGTSAQEVNSSNAVGGDMDHDASSSAKGGGGRKKGKKGKKVSPSVLGFNVVSNRIMMGEIQTVED